MAKRKSRGKKFKQKRGFSKEELMLGVRRIFNNNPGQAFSQYFLNFVDV